MERREPDATRIGLQRNTVNTVFRQAFHWVALKTKGTFRSDERILFSRSYCDLPTHTGHRIALDVGRKENANLC